MGLGATGSRLTAGSKEQLVGQFVRCPMCRRPACRDVDQFADPAYRRSRRALSGRATASETAQAGTRRVTRHSWRLQSRQMHQITPPQEPTKIALYQADANQPGRDRVPAKQIPEPMAATTQHAAAAVMLIKRSLPRTY